MACQYRGAVTLQNGSRIAPVIEAISGKVDIVIGTHKLLQPDVQFENLGLVIIDEEHRFGVRQKERLEKTACRSRYPDADCHTYSAHVEYGHGPVA